MLKLLPNFSKSPLFLLLFLLLLHSGLEAQEINKFGGSDTTSKKLQPLLQTNPTQILNTLASDTTKKASRFLKKEKKRAKKLASAAQKLENKTQQSENDKLAKLNHKSKQFLDSLTADTTKWINKQLRREIRKQNKLKATGVNNNKTKQAEQKALNQVKDTEEVKELNKKTKNLKLPDSLKNVLGKQETLIKELKMLKGIKNDTLKRKEAKKRIKDRAKSELKKQVLQEASKTKELDQATEVAGYVKNIKKDSIQVDKLAEDLVNKSNYGKEFEKMKGQDPFKEMKGKTDQMSKEAKSLQDKEQLEKYAKEKASKLGKADMAKYAPQIQAAQEKFMKYKKKMEWFKEGGGTNGNSLKDTPLKERLSYGANIQVPTISPLAITAAPYISYRLNKKFSTGVSVTYKFSLDNTRIFKVNTAGSEYGYRVFTDYKLIKSWFAHGEFEQLNKMTKSLNSEHLHTQLQTNAYIGAGRQIKVTKGLKLNVMFLCNLLHKDLKYLNPNAFQFRVGLGK